MNIMEGNGDSSIEATFANEFQRIRIIWQEVKSKLITEKDNLELETEGCVYADEIIEDLELMIDDIGDFLKELE